MLIIYGLHLLKKRLPANLNFCLFACLFCTRVTLWCSRLIKNLRSSDLSLLSAGVTNVCHHTKLESQLVPASSYLHLLLLLFLSHFFSLLLLPPKSQDISCSLHGWVPTWSFYPGVMSIAHTVPTSVQWPAEICRDLRNIIGRGQKQQQQQINKKWKCSDSDLASLVNTQQRWANRRAHRRNLSFRCQLSSSQPERITEMSWQSPPRYFCKSLKASSPSHNSSMCATFCCSHLERSLPQPPWNTPGAGHHLSVWSWPLNRKHKHPLFLNILGSQPVMSILRCSHRLTAFHCVAFSLFCLLLALAFFAFSSKKIKIKNKFKKSSFTFYADWFGCCCVSVLLPNHALGASSLLNKRLFTPERNYATSS